MPAVINSLGEIVQVDDGAAVNSRNNHRELQQVAEADPEAGIVVPPPPAQLQEQEHAPPRTRQVATQQQTNGGASGGGSARNGQQRRNRAARRKIEDEEEPSKNQTIIGIAICIVLLGIIAGVFVYVIGSGATAAKTIEKVEQDIEDDYNVIDDGNRNRMLTTYYHLLRGNR